MGYWGSTRRAALPLAAMLWGLPAAHAESRFEVASQGTVEARVHLDFAIVIPPVLAMSVGARAEGGVGDLARPSSRSRLAVRALPGGPAAIKVGSNAGSMRVSVKDAEVTAGSGLARQGPARVFLFAMP